MVVLLPRVPAGRHDQHFLRGGGGCGGGVQFVCALTALWVTWLLRPWPKKLHSPARTFCAAPGSRPESFASNPCRSHLVFPIQNLLESRAVLICCAASPFLFGRGVLVGVVGTERGIGVLLLKGAIMHTRPLVILPMNGRGKNCVGTVRHCETGTP